ncbi:MAG: carbohydrate kinase [Bacteroidales bacterium]
MSKRKVIGIGETVFDIVFKNNQPVRGVPGGSVFNTMISLGRLGAETTFISEVGRDKVGKLIYAFMEENHVKTDHMYAYFDGKSPVSLAFLNDRNEAEYDFYMNYPTDRLDIVWPRIDADDIVIFGSLYSLNPAIRPVLTDLLNYAKERKAIIYYDPNFRKNHESQVMWLKPAIIENLEFADIVRGSTEDFATIYKESDIDKVYVNHIRFYCPYFICTDGAAGVYLRTPQVKKHYPVPALEAVSTIGAGDALNAGILYALLKYNITLEMIPSLEEESWDKLIAEGIRFAGDVCMSYDNYISTDFAGNCLL